MKLFIYLLTSLITGLAAAETQNVHAFNYLDLPIRYPRDFTHFDQVNPEAPKGGTLRRYSEKEFNSTNPLFWSLNYTVAEAPEVSPLVYQSLMTEGLEHDGSMYALIIESLDISDDFRQVDLNLNSKARFHSGLPVTAEDVLFSINLYRTGSLYGKQHMAVITKSEIISPYKLRFLIEAPDRFTARMAISQLGETTLFEKASTPTYVDENSGLTEIKWDLANPPSGTGPYRIKSFERNRQVIYQRDPNYWGANVPSQKGRYNFDEISYIYIRDPSVGRLAFTKGDINYWQEKDIRQWPSFESKTGRFDKMEFVEKSPSGLSGLAFNNLRDRFKDRRVRKALALVYNFEQINRMYFDNDLVYSRSIYTNTPFAHQNDLTAAESELLKSYGDQVSPEAFLSNWPRPPRDESGYRERFREALSLFKESGYTFSQGKMLDPKGQPVVISFIYTSPETEKIILPYKAQLARIGVELEPRRMDITAYTNAYMSRDWDLRNYAIRGFAAPLKSDLDGYFASSEAEAQQAASIGIRNPVIDDLIQKYSQATSLEERVTLGRVIDRVVLSEYYFLSNGMSEIKRIAYDKTLQPNVQRKESEALSPTSTWWSKP